MKEYKAISLHKGIWQGMFDTEKMTKTLNSYAESGWTVKAISTTQTEQGAIDTCLVVLEREAD